jgi:Sulfotransferase family
MEPGVLRCSTNHWMDEHKLASIYTKPNPLPKRRHLLLIGAPRSGTTLLATMIGRHTDVGMVNEDVTGRAIRKVLGKQLTGNKLCVPNQIQLRRRDFFAARLLKRLGVIGEAPKSKYCIRDYLELPNLKVIAIIRDGSASISSMMVRGGARLRKAARRWAEAIETIDEINRQYHERVLVVAFEDLLLQPEKTLRKICTFLNVNFQEPMLHGYEDNPSYPGVELDTKKANPKEKTTIDLQLPELMPAAYEKYRALVVQARENLIK